MSPQVGDDRLLPSIPEEPFLNDAADPKLANAALPQNIDNVLPPASVPPVTMDEDMPPPPPPYPEQAEVIIKKNSRWLCFTFL